MVDEAVPKMDRAVRGRVLQSLADYLYEVDPARAVAVQKSAFESNRSLLRPPSGAVARPPEPTKIEAASRVIRWVKSFENPNGAVAYFQALATVLSFQASSERFEQALKDLAEIIGAEGVRPDKEFGEGPDNLILRHEVSLVIEAKNEAQYDAIPKRDAGQIHNSLAWFKDNYPGRDAVPVIVVDAEGPANGAVLPAGTRLITRNDLRRLVLAVEGFVAALVAQATTAGLTVKNVGILLGEQGLDPKGFVERFTTEPRLPKAGRR